MSLVVGLIIGVALAAITPWVMVWLLDGRHFHRYRFVGMKGVNAYSQCRCGDRKVKVGRGFTPVDYDWVFGKRDAWESPRPTQPPPKPADAAYSASPARQRARPAPPRHCAWNTLQETCVVCGYPEYCPTYGHARAA